MEDEAYARELLAILTNPEPTGIDPEDPYGQADDGIDRYDGFGRDVWVEAVGVVAGEFGAEFVVTFGVHGVAEKATVSLPGDARWRELSGYADPAAYAPAVAREVEAAASRPVARPRPAIARDEQWRMLLDALADEGTVRETGPGRIEVDIDGDVVVVVVTPDEWERVLAGQADVSIYISGLLGPRDPDDRFVVYYKDHLVRSTREERPPVRGRALERELAELHAREPGRYGWVAEP